MNSREDLSILDNTSKRLIDAAVSGNVACSNLIVCEDGDFCSSIMNKIAAAVLKTANLGTCVDFLSIEPTGAMRQIAVDDIRDLRISMYMSPKICDKKFVAIFDADRMNAAAANAFLKVLEEPPSDTVIFLTTRRLHAVIPTIVSRCCIFHLPHDQKIVRDEHVENWMSNYTAWLDDIINNPCHECTHQTMEMYKLLSQLNTIFSNLVEKSCCDDVTEQEAKRTIAEYFFLNIEKSTGKFFRQCGDCIKFFPRVVSNLEEKYRLMTFNVGFMVCIESFFIENLLIFRKIPE